MAIDDAVCAKRLIQKLKEKHISRTALQKDLGTGIQTIAEGRGTTVLKKYQKIADALGISSGFLVGEHDDPHGPEMTGKRKCKTCGREIYGNKFECSTCLKKRMEERQNARKPAVKADHGLVGTMSAASMIAREARRRGMSYGQYAAIYDHKEVKI